MRIQNVDSRGNNGSYEVLVICKNFAEFDKIEDKLIAGDFEIDSFTEWEISVFGNDDEYTTKKEFQSAVKKTLYLK